jgi:hypothetical protein
MKEFIEKEKARLQALIEPGREPVRLELIDSYTLTRVAPHFDAGGELKRVDFWLLFKAVGYDEGFQHAHTVKVVRWSQEDTYLIDLTDDRGWRFHVELVFPDQEPDLAADWRRWRWYKSENRDRFERIDADLLAEHVRIAEEWE